jgi:hypothetical protein
MNYLPRKKSKSKNNKEQKRKEINKHKFITINIIVWHQQVCCAVSWLVILRIKQEILELKS